MKDAKQHKGVMMTDEMTKDMPRCPDCGYTELDAGIHMDHNLCSNKNPPWNTRADLIPRPVTGEALDHIKGQLIEIRNRANTTIEDVINVQKAALQPSAGAAPIITERGFAGHFCASQSCRFRRNTLIDFGDRKIVVSTVGNMWAGNKPEIIGVNRYYETMAFEAVFHDGYWEADIGKEISFESEWAISELEQDSDAKADQMHDAVVRELSTLQQTERGNG